MESTANSRYFVEVVTELEGEIDEPSELQKYELGRRAHDGKLGISFVYVRNLKTAMFEWACISEMPVKFR